MSLCSVARTKTRSFAYALHLLQQTRYVLTTSASAGNFLSLDVKLGGPGAPQVSADEVLSNDNGAVTIRAVRKLIVSNASQ